MSWCTAAEVAELISLARLRGDVDAATRKAADLRFIDVCTNAINAGDVLMQIATEATAPAGLRLNAVFAAQPLITQRGWSEGGQFSDHSAVTRLLLNLVSAANFEPSTKVNAELMRCLALIVPLEFPTDAWQEWLQQCAIAFVSAVDGAATTAVALLHAVVSESYRSYPLWSFLASDVTNFLLQTQPATLQQRTETMTVFLELMRKRPRPSAEHEIATAGNCVLLSPAMRSYVMQALHARVAETQAGDGAVMTAAFLVDCTTVFAVASRLVVDVESAVSVFGCSSFFLTQLQSAAARGAMSGELSAFAEQLLECLLSTLQVFPEVASTDVQADTLLTCLIHFMILPEEPQGRDAAELSTELLEFFKDDEAVPLGCGSGDVANLAGAVLELYLEHNPLQRTLAITTLNTILRDTPHMSGALADAVALALRSVSRVYEAADAVVVDALDAATQAELLTHVSQLLLCTTDPHAHVMLMDALTHCFYGTRSEGLCRQLVQLLQQLYVSAATAMEAECSACVQCACVYEAGRLVEEARTKPFCGSLLDAAWAELALQLLSTGDTFGVFCATSTLCTLFYSTPASLHYVSAHAQLWERGLHQLCTHATVRGVAQLLTLALKHIAGVAAASSTSSALSSSSSSASPPHDCALLLRSCEAVMQFCQQPSPSRHLVLRSVVDFTAAHTRAVLRGRTSGSGCPTCPQQVAQLTLPLLSDRLLVELVQEEPSCRAVASFAALLCVAHSAVQPQLSTVVCAALLRALQHSVAHTHSSQTISCVCGHLGLVLLLQPSLLDDVSSAVLLALFSPDVNLVENRKGVLYGGVAFFLSLFFLRHPQSPLRAATAERHDGVALSIQRAFGWWLSLAPFIDTTQFVYFVAASCRIVDAVAATPAEAKSAVLTNMIECRQFVLPSTHVKKLPSRPCTNAHVLQHLSLAWVDLERRYSRTGKPQLFDADLQPCLAPLDQHYASVCGESFGGGSAAMVLGGGSASPAETIANMVRLLSGHDGGQTIGAARQLLSRLAT